MYETSALEYLKLTIYYASYLYFAAAAFLIWVMATRSARSRVIAGAVLVPLTVLAYARFVEPRVLFTVEHAVALEGCFPEAGEFRIAVFSDTHIGIFANAMPIERIARAAKAAAPDAVLIAGDLTYNLDPRRFAQAFGPLGGVGAPVYYVLGNHDVGLPGLDVSEPLKGALAKIGAIDLEDRTVDAEFRGAVVEFAGLSDMWRRRQVIAVTERPSEVPRILLTHQPRTLYKLTERSDVDLLIAGHTHGGQIFVPGLTCDAIPIACSPFRHGFERFEPAGVFITSGTGMSGVPLRFLVPPRVDVLNVSYGACPAQ